MEAKSGCQTISQIRLDINSVPTWFLSCLACLPGSCWFLCGVPEQLTLPCCGLGVRHSANFWLIISVKTMHDEWNFVSSPKPAQGKARGPRLGEEIKVEFRVHCWGSDTKICSNLLQNTDKNKNENRKWCHSAWVPWQSKMAAPMSDQSHRRIPITWSTSTSGSVRIKNAN